MAQINPPKSARASRRDELREDHLTTAYAHSSVFLDRYRKQAIAGGVGVVLLVVGAIAFGMYRSNQAEQAQEALGAILTEYEEGRYEQALNGTDAAPGLLEIADRYGSSTGSLAAFFAADALFQLGRYDEALAYFERYRGDGLLRASALAGQAAVHEERGDPARAASLYEQAAGAFDSPATTPGYLMDAGRAFEAAGDMAAARRVYGRVVETYDNTPDADLAAMALARAEAASGVTG